jgi:hypothetical protein
MFRQKTTTAVWPEGVIARFVNHGGALVDLHHKRFTTRWRPEGPPFAAHKPYKVDGYNWRCLGCTAYGREGDTYNDPGYRDMNEARAKAQEHADLCRALPRPEVAR